MIFFRDSHVLVSMDPTFFDISRNFTDNGNKFITAITATSFIIEAATIIHVLIVLRIFARITVVHRNMKITCYNMWIGVILKSFVNLIGALRHLLHVGPLTPGIASIIYNVTRDLPNMLVYFLPVTIVCERVCATVHTDKYENWFSLRFIVALCVVPWLIAIWLTVHLLFLQQYFTILYSYFFCDAVTLGLYAIYFVLYFCTLNTTTFGTLSERYQRYENRTACRTVARIAIVSAATFLVTVVHNVTLKNLNTWFPQYGLHDKVALNRLLMDTAVASLIFTLPYHFTYLHANMHRKYMKTMSFCHGSPVNQSSSGDCWVCINFDAFDDDFDGEER
uniref:G_PROTEIN_RECEP_F1_2 domain-containing protein n=1 Tax=Panagrellus redivivus TaxID=6233 RepID=A0A7E4VAC3_PANRE